VPRRQRTTDGVQHVVAVEERKISVGYDGGNLKVSQLALEDVEIGYASRYGRRRDQVSAMHGSDAEAVQTGCC
jgi:hypothetical protein